MLVGGLRYVLPQLLDLLLGFGARIRTLHLAPLLSLLRSNFFSLMSFLNSFYIQRTKDI
jgi:hypothetical protein